ncbi:DUF1643 domain-containing protein [Methylocystis suflitae]|uniref:DUF1643 domain-containing protein n=1 Tax=Methylocystis suflitae TaxID=2951405 RepID=UPI00210988C1|nr:DUF1643 domain-containing protein [Methylocystis suflitae]MCQ4189429.1 DUF1643 domain-containing protein [Methylocystis suflitae]
MPDLSGAVREIERAAVISACGAYRYSLTRRWSGAPLLPFVMLNPSTADAKEDDPTIRRCIGFARREGAGGLIVANLYGLRSPSPEALWSARDPIGPENWRTLVGLAAQAIAQSLPIICAWGAQVRGDRVDEALRMFHASGARLACLGRTRRGAPRHPLYVRASQSLERFP